MLVRLHFDADAMDDDVVNALRWRGADVETALESGLKDATDEKQLAYAAEQGRVLYSFNIGDFMALHVAYINEGKDHAGIILAPQQRYSVGEQMRNTVEFLGMWG